MGSLQGQSLGRIAYPASYQIDPLSHPRRRSDTAAADPASSLHGTRVRFLPVSL